MMCTMGDRGPALCPHGMTSATCLICETLTPSRAARGRAARARSEAAREPARRRSVGVGPTVVVLAVVAIAGLLVVSWVAAFAWALIRLVELVAVATVAGWVGWRLGVRHGRRHPA
jgi:lysylphosphatidylglycerol synthetase-like protein (DUF2156 family)